jgi:hypothetical protein
MALLNSTGQPEMLHNLSALVPVRALVFCCDCSISTASRHHICIRFEDIITSRHGNVIYKPFFKKEYIQREKNDLRSEPSMVGVQ